MGRINENLFQTLSPLFGENNPVTNGNLLLNNAHLPKKSEKSDSMTTQPGAKNVNAGNGDVESKEVFWVRKGTDGRKISENLLRDNFGFEDIDVQAYKKLYGELKIFDEKQCATNIKENKECDWTTPKQIEKWQTSADGQKVFVALPQKTVKFLQDFRQERLIERRVTEITDPEFRAQVENSLKTIVTKQEESRAAAFTNLKNALENNSPDGKKAAEIVKLIADLPENKENPLTQMLLAKIELKEIFTGKNVMYNPKEVAAFKQRINRAADLASGFNETTKTRDPKKALSREEAKVLNEEAARLAEKHGNPSDLRFRTLLARFYEVDDAERSKYEAMSSPQWMTLPRLKNPDERAFTAASRERLALERFNRENPPQNGKKDLAEDPQKKEWRIDYERNEKGEKVLGKDGKPVETQISRRYIEGSMREQDTTYKVETRYDEKGKPVKNFNSDYSYSKQSTVKTRDEGAELNRAGTTRAFKTAGAVGKIEEVNKWTPLLADIYYGTTAKRIAMREKLEKAVFNANNYPIPPKPEKIQQMKRELLTYRYASQRE